MKELDFQPSSGISVSFRFQVGLANSTCIELILPSKILPVIGRIQVFFVIEIRRRDLIRLRLNSD